MARFFLPEHKIQENCAVIDGPELAHLVKVLRLRVGDAVTVFDNTGWEHDAVIEALTAERGVLKIVGSQPSERDPTLPIVLAVGLTKGEKLDFVIEKATELGVATIIPFVSKYTVPKMDMEKIRKRTERWQKIAVSAAKQCGRTRLPEVRSLCSFETLSRGPWLEMLKIIFWEKENQQSLHQLCAKHPSPKAVLLAVGPEGGFNSLEIELAKSQDFEPVHIGRRILRAETAALAALTLVQFVWGDLQ